MTVSQADYDAAADPDVPDDDLDADELARRRSQSNAANAARRTENRRIRELEAENAELKGKVGGYERAEALAAAKRDLNFEGPLDAFLRANPTVEPTADAIQKAVESDPDFKGLITFTPDINEAAAQVGAENAARLAGGQGAAVTQITPADAQSWTPDRIRAFRESHPDAWSQLLAGETVPVPAATVTT